MGAEARAARRRLTWTVALAIAVIFVQMPLSTTAIAGNNVVSTFTYSCCTSAVLDAGYHPGEVIHLTWRATANAPRVTNLEVITLSARISGPYRTVALLKSSLARIHPRLGKFRAESNVVRVSDGVLEPIVEIITVPRDATAGFYELTTSSVTPSLVTNGGVIIRVT